MKRLMSILLTLVLVLTMIPGMAVTAHADTVASGECGENLTWIAGEAKMGWVQEDGVWYHYDDNGGKQTGWQDIGNSRYYFDDDGRMLTGEQTIDGESYTFDEYGRLTQDGVNQMPLAEITFPGDAPGIEDEAFADVTATGYYPGDNATRTEEVRQNYGGTVTWAVKVAGGACGENLTWSLDEDGVLTISGTGSMKNYSYWSDSNQAPWTPQRESITSVVVEPGVTTIGDSAFWNCNSLTSVTLPEGLTSIGNDAFYECNSLTSVTLPESVTTIGSYAFYGCSSLTSIEIPAGVTEIGESVFFNCYSLTSITLPAGLTTIGDHAFPCCYSLTSITLPESLTSIGSEAFGGCYNLTSIKIPAGVTEIGNGAFGGVPVEAFTVAEGSASFCTDRYGALYTKDMTRLVAFPRRSSATAYAVPAGVTEIGGAFYGCDNLTSITLPEGLTTIGKNAFYDCDNLTNITLPDGLTSIGDYAFCNCSSLTSMTLPEGVTSIGNGAFQSCSSLTSIEIPAGVTEIKWYTFANCTGLKSVVFLGGAPGIHDSAFTNVTATAYYPAGNASWTEEVRRDYDGKLTWQPHKGAGSCGDSMFWILDGNGVLTIFGTGDMYDYWGERAPWYAKAGEITSAIVEAGVAGISDAAFYGCKNMAEITFRGNAPTFGENCFRGVTTTAYYPLYDDTWTEEVRQNYGGTVTWAVKAPGGSCGDELTWRLDEDGVLTISGTGSMYDYEGWDESRRAPWTPQRESITSVVVEPGVTTIGAWAFGWCSNVTSITLPESVTSIGERAFSGCSGLTSIEIPAGVTVIDEGLFYDCTSLTSITLPAGVTTIGRYAFSGCSGLTSIEIPAGVTVIDEGLFSGCTGLTGVTLPESLTTIGAWAFNSCSSLTSIEIPAGVTEIGGSAFYNCDNLTSVTLPEGLTTIGNYAFYNCDNLTSVTLPESLTSIGDYAFNWCSSLTSIALPGSLTTIGDGAFQSCWNLTDVKIPAGVTEIGDGAFGGVPVEAFTVAEGSASFCTDQYGALYTKDMTRLVAFPRRSSATAYAVPAGVTEIGGAFYGCYNLTSITLPEGLTTIGDYAFAWCGSLTSIALPDGVTTIGNGAFQSCSSLTSIALPESLTNIGEYAFYRCGSLTSIALPAGLTTIGYGAFDGCTGLKSVVFLGGAPSIDGSFTGVTATAYYPAGNASWTEEVRQNYGGKLTWQPHKGAGSCGDSMFWLLDGNGVLTIFGTGDMYDYWGERAPWYAKAGEITSAIVEAGVAGISDAAFYGCKNMAEITFRGNAPTFGENCFRGVTTTAYYPLYDDTWTEEVRQNYGGTVTWAAKAPGGSCGDDLTWRLEDGVLTISGTGSMYDYEGWDESRRAPWYSLKDRITSVVVESGVTGIGDYAFYECSSLTSVTLPEGLTTIGEDAFRECASLTSITLPESLTTIGRYAFGSTSLSDVKIPASVESIEDGAFMWCGQLAHIDVDSESAFYCTKDGVLFTRDMATLVCYPAAKDGASYVIPDSVTTVGVHGFSSAHSLVAITIPDSVTKLSNCAFHDCANIPEITIPKSVTEIGCAAFENCNALTAITVEEGNAYYSSLDGVLFNGDRTNMIWYPANRPGESYTIPDSVVSIGNSEYSCVFRNSKNLLEVTIPASVRRLTGTIFNFTDVSIKFLGRSPEMNEYCFWNSTVTVYYPENDSTWDIPRQMEFGNATVTWVPYEREIPDPPERMAGATRQTTAVAISRAAFPNGSDNVILASGDNYPDALAGGPLAYELDAPILLIRRSRPDDQATLDEIRRLGAKNVYILGGAGVVSDAVADTMKDMGLTVERIAGANRFDTAVAVAEKLEALRGAKPTTVFFVYSHNYPDALAVSNVASLMGAPILYVDNTGNLRDSTAAYLKHLGSVEKAYIISGPGVIGPNADTAIGAFGPVQRIYGADRYETCTRINRTFADVLDGNSLCLACGTNYPDALAGSVFAAKYHAPMVLVRGGLTAEQAAYVKEKAPENVYAFGGAGVLPDSVLDAVKQAAR